MSRFTRNISVNVVQRKPVYSDQEDYDLEKLAASSFDEKRAFAEALKAQNEQKLSELQMAEEAKRADKKAEELATITQTKLKAEEAKKTESQKA